MEGTLQVRRLFTSPLVAISDVQCRPHDGACGHEECSASNDIVFPRSGLFVRHAAGEQVVADANHVLLFHEHETYRVSHPVPGGDDCTALTFAPDLLHEAFGAVHPAAIDRPDRPFPMSHAPSNAREFTLQYALSKSLRLGFTSTIAVEETAVAILASVVDACGRRMGSKRASQRNDTTRAHRDLAHATKTLLADRFPERLTLDRIALGVHSSTYHLARVFRRQAGLPIHRYLSRLRLRASLVRIADGGSDLTTVALAVGFASHSHFSDAFRREFGLSPTAMRRQSLTTLLRKTSKISEA